MGLIASKTVDQLGGQVGLSFTDSFYCSDDELYKTTPLTSAILTLFRQDGMVLHTVSMKNFVVNLYPNASGRLALTYDSQVNSASLLISGNLNTASFDYILQDDEFTWTNSESNGWPSNLTNWKVNGVGSITTNIPVFSSESDALAYLNAASQETALLQLSYALNYKPGGYQPEETKTWTYTALHGTASILRGTVNPTSETGYRTLKFRSNTEPAFYIDENTFECYLIAPNVIDSVTVAGPESVLDNIPESQWTVGSLAYTGPFYTTLSQKIQKQNVVPEDGTYLYPVEYQTNIPIFGNQADAENAVITGDYSKAGPSAIKEYDVKLGEEETGTEFGGGGFMSPFFTILSGSKSDIHRLAEVLFTTDGNLWDDIKAGLALYGSNPIDYVIDIKAYGFNLANVTTQSTRSDVWFGSYQHHFDSPFNEIINLSANYIDAGSFFMYPIQYCYLDMDPYTTASIYIPYHGWADIDLKKYYNKMVNCRYYVDVLTGQALFVTLCDGILCDQFGPFEVGTEMPLTGTNFAQWAQGQVRLLTQAAQSLVGGVTGGATSGNVAGFASSSLQSLIPATQALQEAKQQGGVRNTMTTKGNFTAQIGNYMPGYVFFRFDIHEMLEPTNLQALCGLPSYTSGNVRNFSGFLQADVVKLDTSGMSDEEAAQIMSLLQEGIYI